VVKHRFLRVYVSYYNHFLPSRQLFGAVAAFCTKTAGTADAIPAVLIDFMPFCGFFRHLCV
jgi:hypothetical protein